MDGRVSNRHRISRRAALRGSALGATGLLGAALIGCGDDDDAPPSTPGGGNGQTSTPPVGEPAPGEVRRGGTLRQATPEDIATYDMHQSTNLYEVEAMVLVYDQLLQYDPFDDGSVIGNLAYDWEVPEETSIVFHLNEATFHDGTPFTSEDVAVSMERQKNPPDGVSALRQPSFDVLESVDTPDERTVVFNMNRPSASFLNLMAVSYMSIYSTQDMLNDGFDHRDEMNGTGPYILDNYQRGSQMTFVRNPNYFDEGDLPYLESIERFVVPEEVTRLAAFRSGDADIFGPGVTQVESVLEAGGELLTATHFSYYTFTIATWKEPWNDERVWEAVSLTTDRDATNVAISDGRGFTGGPLPPGSPFALSPEEMAQYPGYSGDLQERRTEARQLLDAAGIDEGTPVSVLSWGGSTAFENHAILFGDGLQHIGLVPDLRLEERATYDERLNGLDFGDMAANSRNAALDDPTPVFADNYIEGAGRHYTQLIIPEVEDLYRQQESELDPDARRELAFDLQRALLSVYPAEIAHFGELRLALQPDVRGYGVLYGNSRASRKLQHLWLDR